MKRVTITLPDDLADLVGREARRHQTSFSEAVRHLIERGLSKSEEKPREIPWASLFHDPGMVLAECFDEDLADHWADHIDHDRG